MKWLPAAILCGALAACTPGGMLGNGGGTPGGAQITVIDVNLTLHTTPTQLLAGTSAGYAPAQTTVAVGTFVQFVNSDGFMHTASGIHGAATFPANRPFDASAAGFLNAPLSGTWSTGTLQAGQRSQPIAVDAPGTYLFGCYYHYGAPMRGAIVAQ